MKKNDPLNPAFTFSLFGTLLKTDELPETVSSSWKSPSNIAMIKYWGKREGQVPANPSLSMTLRNAVSRTKVIASQAGNKVELLSVNGDPQHPFTPKLTHLLNWMIKQIPPLHYYSFSVETSNTFPHSTGIASSASGISAFTLCILSIAKQIFNIEIDRDLMKRMASLDSRMVSGSACRSVYGGFAVWGETQLITGSSDEYSVPVNDLVHPSFQNLEDAILIVSKEPKSVSSTYGHSLMNTHPFAGNRKTQAGNNLKEALNALQSGDFEHLGRIAENEAFTLHSLIMTSLGNPILIAPETVRIIKRIQQLREHGIPLFFTLDAGPNVHLLYPASEKQKTEDIISSELLPYCTDGEVIFDGYGTGPINE